MEALFLKVTITRTESSPMVTLGNLKIDGGDHPIIYTLEEPWKKNLKSVSCIPVGEYVCKPHSSAKFPNVWEITNVPNRSAILIHNGNTTNDVEGCVLVGLKHGKIGNLDAVLDSRKALDILRSIIGERNFTLTIK